MVFNLINRPFN